MLLPEMNLSVGLATYEKKLVLFDEAHVACQQNTEHGVRMYSVGCARLWTDLKDNSSLICAEVSNSERDAWMEQLY